MAPVLARRRARALGPASLERRWPPRLALGHPRRVTRGADAARTRAIEQQLADVVDLLRLAATGGATVRTALAGVARHLDGPVADAFAALSARVDAGSPLVDELDHLRPVLGPAGDALVSLLRAATLDGAPLAPALDRLATELRDERRRRAETRARQLPVRLLFPLVCCALPALVLLAVVPLLVATLRTLHL
jgi:tight adherence protein C